MEFDTEKFIIEVERRPSLWNSKSSEYADRNKKVRNWEELVDIFGVDDNTLAEKKTLGQSLQKKWKNLRDNFMKELKKQKNIKSGSAAKSKPAYVYFQQLIFLKDTVNITESSVDSEVTENSREGPYQGQEEHLPRKRNKKGGLQDDEFGKELIGVLKKNVERRHDDNDEDKMFFMSLVKEFKKIPEHMQMEKKIEIMGVIKNGQFPNVRSATGYEYHYNRDKYNYRHPPSEFGYQPSGSRYHRHHTSPEMRLPSPAPTSANSSANSSAVSPPSENCYSGVYTTLENATETHITSPSSVASQMSNQEILGLFEQ